jgi:hypothetical protein
MRKLALRRRCDRETAVWIRLATHFSWSDSSRTLALGVGCALADDEKIGTVWSDNELDAIVADYFAMLDSELAGVPHVKSHHIRLRDGFTWDSDESETPGTGLFKADVV